MLEEYPFKNHTDVRSDKVIIKDRITPDEVVSNTESVREKVEKYN